MLAHVLNLTLPALILDSRFPEPSLARVVECFLRSIHSFVCFIDHFHWLYTSEILRNREYVLSLTNFIEKIIISASFVQFTSPTISVNKLSFLFSSGQVMF